jgi:hypothetical protein
VRRQGWRRRRCCGTKLRLPLPLRWLTARRRGGRGVAARRIEDVRDAVLLLGVVPVAIADHGEEGAPGGVAPAPRGREDDVKGGGGELTTALCKSALRR